ncbi:MAG: 16S rRNA (guanine(966)-N(2))-methyltransferase RsmD [Ruminococcaceae bacterium]|nr:16S rRNA (guanine(966)-N(2))-methyltransferase RsmD [Oscillospiraceae bacterium]
MKVITGTLRGRTVQTLAGEATRPTAQRVKEALFSAIQFDIEGRRVLDAFAGSGQLGIEAISRGAASCVFVDNSREAAEIVRRNTTTLGIGAVSTVLCQDTMQFLSRTAERFDIVFLDPPYAAGLLEDALAASERLLNAGGLVVCESDERAQLPESVGALTLYRSYHYSHVKLWIYR